MKVMSPRVRAVAAFVLAGLACGAGAFAQDVQWVRQGTGTPGSFNFGTAIASDTFGNSYLTGGIGGAVTFATGVLLTPSPNGDGFVAKYNAVGERKWVKAIGGFGRAIVVDAQGNSYVAGGYCGQVIFAPGEANATTLNGINCSSFSRYDTFVAKYDSAGAFLWVVSATASGGIGTNPEIVVGGIG